MNMPRIIFIFAVIFVLLGVGAYVVTGSQSPTALIPALLGLLLAVAGAFSLKSLKHGGHAAATLGLLGFLGSASGLLKLPAVLSGAPVEHPAAVVSKSIMAVLCLVFVALCVKSFIDARKQPKTIELRTVKCPACSADVSSQAYACPKCGQPLNKSENPAEKTYQRIKWFTAGIGLLILLFLLRGCPVVVIH